MSENVGYPLVHNKTDRQVCRKVHEGTEGEEHADVVQSLLTEASEGVAGGGEELKRSCIHRCLQRKTVLCCSNSL